ncbi:MAG: hypothetical protein OER04_00175 [Cyclobacteriaceae bacterium]|nr:hypothetical protein [Cyclobacteriaceae bacterium]
MADYFTIKHFSSSLTNGEELLVKDILSKNINQKYEPIAFKNKAL